MRRAGAAAAEGGTGPRSISIRSPGRAISPRRCSPGARLATGEDVLAHADGSAAVLAEIGAAPELRAAAFLVYAADQLGKPDEVLTPLFGESQATLVAHARKLGDLQRAAQGARVDAADKALQTERVRKMLLAFSRDLRVVLLRLASRLQTLRWFAASKTPGAHAARRPRRCRCSRRSPTGSASGRSSGSSRTSRSASSIPRATTRSPASSTSGAPTARRGSCACAPSSRPTSRRTA